MKRTTFLLPCLALASLLFSPVVSWGGQVFFSNARVSVDEGATAVLKVSRSGSVARPVSVRWSTSSGTARAGADFTQAAGVVSFAAGVRTAEMQVEVNSDHRLEKSEFFFVRLASSAKGMGWPWVATVTIRDATVQCAGDIACKFPHTAPGPARDAFEQPDGRIVMRFEDWETGRNLRRYWPQGEEDMGFQPDIADDSYYRRLIGLRDGGFILETEAGRYRYSRSGKIQASWTGGNVRAECPDGTLLSADGPGLVRLSRDGVELARYSGPWGEGRPAEILFGEVSVARDGSISALWGGVPWTASSREFGLIRLRPSGEVDESFRPAVTWGMASHLPLPDGSMLVASSILNDWYSGGQPRPPLVKLRPDGSLDSSFRYPAEWQDFLINRMSLAPDGRVLLALDHSEFRTLLRRMDQSGTADQDFAAALEKPGDDTPWDSLMSGPWTQKDGSIFVSGSINNVNGVATQIPQISYAPVMLSLHGKSVRCPGFLAPVVTPLFVAENAGASPVTLRRVRGSYGSLTVPLRLVPVTATEGMDVPAAWSDTIVFGPGETEKTYFLPTLDDEVPEPTESAFVEVVETDGQRLVDRAGPLPEYYPPVWERYDGTGYEVRIVDDESQGTPGTPDLTFQPSLPAREYIRDFLPLPSGKMVILSHELRQLLPDGQPDTAFTPDLSGLSGIPWYLEPDTRGYCHVFTSTGEIVALDENGQRLAGFGQNGLGRLQLPAGGRFNSANLASDGGFFATLTMPVSPGAWQHKVMRFNASGVPLASQPTHLNSGLGAQFLAEQPGLGYLVRNFIALNTSRIERCRLDGAFDPSFQTISVSTGWPLRVLVLASGKLLVANQTIRRFESDGMPDPAWQEQPIVNPGYATGALVKTLFEDPQGRIVLGGSLEPVLRRYLPDGSPDPAFFSTSARPFYNEVGMKPARDGSGYYYGIHLTTLNDLPLAPVFRVFGQ